VPLARRVGSAPRVHGEMLDHQDLKAYRVSLVSQDLVDQSARLVSEVISATQATLAPLGQQGV